MRFSLSWASPAPGFFLSLAQGFGLLIALPPLPPGIRCLSLSVLLVYPLWIPVPGMVGVTLTPSNPQETLRIAGLS